MTDEMQLTGEQSNHKVAGVFESAHAARSAREQLFEHTSLEREQVEIVEPGQRQSGRRLLPESGGIWKTMLRSHLFLGLAGALAGVTLFLGLLAAQLPLVANNTFFAAFALIHVGTLVGLMVGGLLTLRPDQVPYVRTARTALRDGHCVLIVHARSPGELAEARDSIQSRASEFVRTA